MNSIEEKKEVSKVRVWLQEVKLGIIPASTVPIFVGTAVAFGLHGIFHLDLFLITLFAGIFLHWGADVTNDYFDHTEERTGSDDINVEFIRPYSGGSRTIQQGLLTPKQVALGAIACYIIAGILGFYLVFRLGWVILAFGGIGAFLGFFYSTPPIRFVKRGVGEFVIGSTFGVLMVVGAYYVQVQTPIALAWPLIIPFEQFLEPGFISIPVAIMIALVLFINEFPDYVADRDAKKRTLVVRMGRKLAAKGYTLALTVMYVGIIVLVFLGWIKFESLLVLSTLPLSTLGIVTALRHHDESSKLAPANWATIVGQMLVGGFLALGYVLYGYSVAREITIVIGIVLFVVLALMARKIGTPAAND
ncbi:prenyltransferase [Candidatus Thorarchaeota archaeon]|nr:MAG: prenyltransferase [Candidatus Thorarchaeota archaeon]